MSAVIPTHSVTLDPPVDDLVQALAAEGLPLDAAAVTRLLIGIAGAPPSRPAGAWAAMIPGLDPTGPAGRAMQTAIDRERERPRKRPPPGDRLQAVRQAMARLGVDAFIVPHADEHQSEFVPRSSERLAWLTGFTGSAGTAVVTADRAVVFVDGRYTLQVRDQVDIDLWEIASLVDDPPSQWLARELTAGATVGVDPWLHTPASFERMAKNFERADIRLKPVPRNPVDEAWVDRPGVPLAPILPHPARLAGRTPEEKCRDVVETIRKAGADAVVLTAPESIAWLLNVRGGDVKHTPMPLSNAVVTAQGAIDWFVAPEKVTAETRTTLGALVTIQPPDLLADRLGALGRARARVLIDPAVTNVWVTDRITAEGGTLVKDRDPCVWPKACKTAAEVAGAREAHIRDGVAVTGFLAWLDREAPAGQVDELAAVAELARRRAAMPLFRGESFPTISGAGPHGAIVHYRVTAETNRPLAPGELYLVDSGAQYEDGTTDLTRTVAVGAPNPAMIRHFTLVLKGHIALARARFPDGTSGSQLDVLARLALWQEGLDFEHGTGHGVGSYLGVHEGPARISKVPNAVPLHPGMILSNEPGYYREGAYGIRIENLVVVRKDGDAIRAGRAMYAFDTLTVAPIDRRLIDPGLLDAGERAWLDKYHKRVWETVGPALEPEDREWLERATKPLV